MTKKELAKATAKQAGLNPEEVEKTIDALCAVSKETVAAGETIHIRGFGSLGTKVRKAKIGRNLQTGAQVAVPAHKIPYFKPSPEFKNLVR